MKRIALYSHKRVVAYAIVDDADAIYLRQYRWLLGVGGYAIRYEGEGGRTCVSMTRQILGLPRTGAPYPDHINRKRLDNRRSNLRAVTKAQNHQNLSPRRNSTSRFRGVHFDAQTGRWRARVRHDGIVYELGRFVSERDAAKAASDVRRSVMPFSYEGVAA